MRHKRFNQHEPEQRAEPVRDVSDARRATYYVGLAMAGFGLVLFLSVFVTGAMDLSSGNVGRIGSEPIRAVAGMILLMLGTAIARMGRGGAAGSGLLLDPQKARRDLEPFSRQQGGMLKDALDEAGVDLGQVVGKAQAPERVVMIKCRECGKLNEDDSKFCQECGAAL